MKPSERLLQLAKQYPRLYRGLMQLRALEDEELRLTLETAQRLRELKDYDDESNEDWTR
jgi:hypothetical protein